MRKLQTKDLFNCMRLISKANLKEELKPVIRLAAEGKTSIEDIGIECILTMIEILTEKKCESALYDVLAGPFEMPAEDIEELDINTFIEKLKDLGEQNNLKVFFTSLQGLITSR